MNICDLMRINVHVVSPNNSVRYAALIMHDRHVGALPVIEAGNLVGMITDRDICCHLTALGLDAAKTTVAEIMQKNVATCFHDQSITDVAYLMASHQIHRIAVVDDDDKLSGIVSVDDIAHESHDLASIILDASAETKR